MLNRVFKGRKDGFYIDVGACDPVIESVTKFFYDEGWSGINIEPNDGFYRKLLKERPRDINLRLALGEHEESRSMHMFDNIGNSTFEDAVRDHYVERGFRTVDQTVRVSTLAAVCRDFVKQEIDFLKIDCEGWEEAVIKGADWERFRPIVVVVEATAPDTTIPAWDAWEPDLIERGRYDFAYFDGLNRFYIRREYADLRRHLEVPPNVFDRAKPYAIEVAEQQRDALQLNRDWLAERIIGLEAEKQHLADQSARDQAQIAELKQEHLREIAERQTERQQMVARLAELEQTLFNTRLWVGRLSQDLAASRQRQ